MILVAGSANLDFVVRAHHIPAPGETVLGRDFKTFPGGKGANQAVAAARAGAAATQMLVALGDDAPATLLETSLREAGVEVLVARIVDQPSGCALICVSDDAQNAITVAPGANAALLPAHLPPLQGISHLLLQLETPLPTVKAFAQAAKAQGVVVVLNAAPAQPLGPELLALVDVLLVNEGELATLCARTGTIAQMVSHTAAPTVVVTLGPRGCLARHQGAFYLQNAFRVDAVDTTGAGDTFCGTLVAALSQGADMAQALRQASAAAALACTQAGAQSSIPLAQEVAVFMSQNAPLYKDDTMALRSYCGLA